ncbi:MAG: hypothetical protein JSU95_16425 [Betaproteobacteria bacterium]|nr:MAG: hypothetical protein JSU95_16425 [Betaproteobacteria bacterium]
MSIFEKKRASRILPGLLALSLSVQVVCAEDTPVTEPQTVDDAESKEKEGAKKEARKREIGVEEDPAVKQAVDAAEKRVEGVVERFDLQLYGSVRLRYRQVDSESVWSDGGSRIGLTGGWQVSDNIRLFARGEAGFNLLDQVDFIFNRGDRPPDQDFGDTFFRRLLNVGAETPHAVLAVGKAWSTYYRVSSFTDRFQGTGASASGTYNAGTDGGNTGTGRADDVLQVRGFVGPLQSELLRYPLTLNVQAQNGEPIPLVDGKNYKTTVGLSTVFEGKSDWAIGVAYNHANINEADLESLRSVGIDGDATALVVGARWYGDDFYAGTVVSRLENHEATAEGIYFDGTGWEVYSQYRFHRRWWAIAGWNILEPRSSQSQVGPFKIDYGVLGIRYSFQDFRQMIFVNARLESSVTQDGRERPNVYTIGVRWDFP